MCDYFDIISHTLYRLAFTYTPYQSFWHTTHVYQPLKVQYQMHRAEPLEHSSCSEPATDISKAPIAIVNINSIAIVLVLWFWTEPDGAVHYWFVGSTCDDYDIAHVYHTAFIHFDLCNSTILCDSQSQKLFYTYPESEN
jgi:hypothetical protein